MARRRGRQEPLPQQVEAALGLGRGERVLAAARTTDQEWLVTTSWRVAVVTADGDVQLARPWWHVDGGAWDPDTESLEVSWVDGSDGARLGLPSPGRVPETLHERVQASVVLMRHLDLGPGRRVRVAIRKDLQDRSLLEQVLPGPGTRTTDPELVAAVVRARAELRDQAGMGPVPAAE